MSRSKCGQVVQGDCLNGFKQLADGVVDLAFADPPFNIGYRYDAYDDNRGDDEYLSWCHEWLSEIVRVVKPDGTFWLAIGDEYAADLKVMMQRQLGLFCRSWVVWYYTFGVNCKYKFSRSHAHLFHMVKDPKRLTFNVDDLRVPSARQLVYGDHRADPKGRLPDDTWILRPQDLPTGFQPNEDTWYFPRVAGTFKERGVSRMPDARTTARPNYSCLEQRRGTRAGSICRERNNTGCGQKTRAALPRL